MNQARFEKLKSVFQGAIEAAPEWRAVFIRRECEGDAELEAEVLALLGRLEVSEGFLEAPARTPPPDAPGLSEATGTPVTDRAAPGAESPLRFATYNVVRTLGRGGMGVVYLAEQDGTKRTVALKVIRAGLATPGALKRFAFEAQVLGRLNHPGIAQVYDAGTGDTGQGPQPYFAMELVDGVQLTQHARARALSIPERLALLAAVCDAVEYAHVKGVIHRDLKPANILVDRAGRVKVLDFGVARATAAAPDSSIVGLPSLNTEAGQMVGTLPYMSPEQIRGDPDDVDTRSDVYALGIIGYELLADKPAFDVERLAPLEAARVVCENDPAPLSSVSKMYRGDIETVIAKAMDKDRGRRYQSAAAMGADIRRYLNDEPVEARPASAWYQMGKLVRRHRTLVCACSVLAAGLLAAAIWSMVLAREARAARREVETAAAAETRARAEAERKSATATAVVQMLVEDWASAISPERSGPELRVRDMLDGVAARIDAHLTDEPEVAATMRVAIGRMYRHLHLPQKALPHFEAAARLRGALRGSETDVWEAENLLALCFGDLQQWAKAREIHSRVLNAQAHTLGPNHQDTLMSRYNLAVVTEGEGRFEDAAKELAQIVEDADAALGPLHYTTIGAIELLGNVLAEQGQYDESERLCSLARARYSQVYGPDHPACLGALNSVALAVQERGDLGGARALFEELYQRCTRVYGPAHPQSLSAGMALGVLLLEDRKGEEAGPFLERAYQGLRELLGDSDEQTMKALSWLAGLRRDQGRLDDAESLSRQYLRSSTERFGPRHRTTLMAANSLINVLSMRKDLHGALELARQTYVDGLNGPGPDDPIVLAVQFNLGSVLLDTGSQEEACALAEDLCARRRAHSGIASPVTLEADRLYMEALAKQNRLDDADAIAREAIEALKQPPQRSPALMVRMILARGAAHVRCGSYGSAEPILREALDTARAEKLDEALIGECGMALAVLYERTGAPERATEIRAGLPAEGHK